MAESVEGDVQITLQERNNEEVQLAQDPEIDPQQQQQQQQQQQPLAAAALQAMVPNSKEELEVLYLSWGLLLSITRKLVISFGYIEPVC